jgi:AcrR family transcriptional regulator
VSPRPSKAAERRPQILAATARAISKRGVTGTRLSDVAREAGVSIGTVQHYFGTRERLLVETFGYETDQSVARWRVASSNGTTAWERLLALVDIVLRPDTFRERWTRWLQFWAAYAREPALRRTMGGVYERWRDPLRQAVDAGVASGEFQLMRPADVVVDRAVALFDGLALQVLLEAPGMSLGRMRDLLVESLAADLGVRTDGAPSRRRQRSQNDARAARAASIPSRPRAGSSGT